MNKPMELTEEDKDLQAIYLAARSDIEFDHPKGIESIRDNVRMAKEVAFEAGRQAEQVKFKEILNKYEGAREIIEKGKRYLVVGDKRYPFGYPYPDSKKQYVIEEFLASISTKDTKESSQ